MAIHSEKNLYPGINPHLNSFLQSEAGGWESFHAELIVQTRMTLDEQLPLGYLAVAEKSLQISEITLPALGKPSKTRPDVMIYQSSTRPSSPAQPSGMTALPTATLPLLETLEEEEFLTSVVIYQAGEGSALGRPITQIEILSPANKPGGSHYPRYRLKRVEILQSGLRLVEVDYLHESRPIIASLPSYPHHEENAMPYMIMVTDPRPSFEQGQAAIYGFGVEDLIPTIPIPLAGADVQALDFGAIYHRVYASLRFCAAVVDYEQQPMHFERYSEADRARIQNKMQAIKNEVK